MVSLPRHFLIALLIFLQFIAPLVHAHIGHEGALAGLHWQAIEKLTTSEPTASVSQSVHSLAATTAIVELGSALKPSNHHADPAPAILSLAAGIIALMAPRPRRLQIFPSVTEHTSPPVRAHSPRSPPHG